MNETASEEDGLAWLKAAREADSEAGFLALIKANHTKGLIRHSECPERNPSEDRLAEKVKLTRKDVRTNRPLIAVLREGNEREEQ